jgi:hypothetical protein
LNRLESVTTNKNENVTGAVTKASLEQNTPNPFNTSTRIRYSIPKGSNGQIIIYDVTGKIVNSVEANQNGAIPLNRYNLSAGTYTYTLMIDGKVALSKQMLIIK